MRGLQRPPRYLLLVNKDAKEQMVKSLRSISIAPADPASNDYVRGSGRIAQLVLDALESRSDSTKSRRALQELAAFARLQDGRSGGLPRPPAAPIPPTPVHDSPWAGVDIPVVD